MVHSTFAKLETQERAPFLFGWLSWLGGLAEFAGCFGLG